MATALATRVFAHPQVQAINVSQLDGWQELGAVFVKAFEDRGREFPIDFDDAYVWLQYGRRDNAIRALKARYTLHTDYRLVDAPNLLPREGVAQKGPAPDKYYLTTDAFERFAMEARTEVGDLVRAFFRAIRDAYVELTAAPQPLACKEDALVTTFHQKNVIYIGEVQAKGPRVRRLCKFGQTADIAKRCQAHKETFQDPLHFELLHVTEVEDRQRAEGAFKDLSQIRPKIQRVNLPGIGKKELLIVPEGLTANKLELLLRKAARLAIQESVDSSTELLLEREKTEQARIALERAKMDHEWRMLTLTCASGPMQVADSVTEAAEEAVDDRDDDEDDEDDEEGEKETPESEEAVTVTAPRDPSAEYSLAEDLIREFIEEHCITGPSLAITSQDFREGLLRAKAGSEHVLGSRRVGIIVHELGFKGHELVRNLRRCRGFSGIALKPLEVPAE